MSQETRNPTMAAQELKKKRKRRRKTRTAEASFSPSSSESEVVLSPEANQDENAEHQSKTTNARESSPSESAESIQQESNVEPAAPPKNLDPEQAFDEFYLKQATKEFANDLDKLRSASDFNERSVPMLIEALRQGRACFTVEERKRVGARGVLDVGEGV